LYRGINEFKKGYKPRINIIKDENGNLLADPQSVLNRWKHLFNQLLNVHGVHNVRQDIHTAEPLVPDPSLVEVEIATGKLQAGAETLDTDTQNLICSIWNKEELPQQWKESIIILTHKRLIRLIVIIIEESPSYQQPTKFYPTFFRPG
jgi:hypothetical protein